MTRTASLRDRLRIETRAAHDALDETLDLIGQPLTLTQYVRLLARFHGFHRAIEPLLARLIEPSLWAGRSKLAVLQQDLGRCGMSAAAMRRLPAPDDLPAITDGATALGALYVSEGSTLGGRIIDRQLQKNPLIPAEARSYFGVYGDQTGARWQAVCEVLETSSPDHHQRTIQSAQLIFASLQSWLAPSQWRDQPTLAEAGATDGGRDRD